MHWLTGLSNQLQNSCTRITLTRYHFLFFLVTFIHTAALVFLHTSGFVINEEARDFMVQVMSMTGAKRDAMAVVANHPSLTLFLCQKVPGSGFMYMSSASEFSSDDCQQVSPPLGGDTLIATNTTIISSTAAVAADQTASKQTTSSLDRRNFLYPDNLRLIPTYLDDGEQGIAGVSIVGLDNSTGTTDSNGNVWLPDACIDALRYPEQEFQDGERENISFLFFHVWIFLISILAIVNESIPHLASALAGQCLAFVWASWDIYRTLMFRKRYNILVSQNLCDNANLIPHYWPTRNKLNVSIACVNFGVLVITFWLTVVLIKRFMTSQFRSVGAAPLLDKLYRILMAFSTILRLYFFFMMLTTAIWIDQLDGGLLHTFLRKAQFNGYLGVCSIALILALPLVFMGDLSMRLERRNFAFAFLLMQGFYVAFHISLLASSSIYRWTLILWPFFALNVAGSFILAVTTLVLGVICRTNFGRGLEHFLHVTSILEKDGFTRGFMAPERSPSKKHGPSGSWDNLLESGGTVKVAAAYHRQSLYAKSVANSKGKRGKRNQRDSTESFGQTTWDPENTAMKTADQVATGASLPVFDNRAVVSAPDWDQEGKQTPRV